MPDVIDRLNTFFDEEEPVEVEEPKAEKPEVEEPEEVEEPKAEEVEEPEEEEVEVIEHPSLRDLAEHLETDLPSLYAVTIPVTLADGSKAEVPLGEIKDSFQNLDIVKAERAKFEEEMEKNREEILRKGQALDYAYTQANQMIEIAEKQILGEIDGLEMTQLRASNPAEYAAKKQEYMEGLGKLNSMRQMAIQSYQQQMADAQQKASEQRQKYLQEQARKMTEIIPEWSDSKVREAESSELTDFLMAQGIPPQEIEQISNAAVVAIARKAMLYDKQQKSAPSTKKKVLSLGKRTLKSGKAPSKAEKQEQKVDAQRKKIRETGSDELAQAYIAEHLLGDF